MATFRCWRVCRSLEDMPSTVNSFNSLGGMCGAIVTSPFDVVKTRLQSDLFRVKHTAVSVQAGGAGVLVGTAPRPGGLLWNFVETGHILRYATFMLAPPCLNIVLQRYISRRVTACAL